MAELDKIDKEHFIHLVLDFGLLKIWVAIWPNIDWSELGRRCIWWEMRQWMGIKVIVVGNQQEKPSTTTMGGCPLVTIVIAQAQFSFTGHFLGGSGAT